jgi:hypothetical protein
MGLSLLPVLYHWQHVGSERPTDCIMPVMFATDKTLSEVIAAADVTEN